MKVLHLFSDARWTGPAEPALNLCLALREAGVDVDFACAPDAGGDGNKIVTTARDRGLEPIVELGLSKHRRPIRDAADIRRLPRLARAHRYDLVHCHLDNDHRIATRSANKHGLPVIRSSYTGTGFPAYRRYARLLRGTAGLIEPAQTAMKRDIERFGFAPYRARVIPNAVDTDRFDPAREVPDARRWLNIPRDAFVVGIVARLQPHRHYHDFFNAIKPLTIEYPNTRAIVVGRGTRAEQVGRRPVAELGLDNAVTFAGHVEGEDYVGMLKAFDVMVYLVPGSDGTCRAVREAMAMGKPVVAADRGMLAEIVEHGTTGIVCDGSPDQLHAALGALANDRRYARDLGRAARRKAFDDYSLPDQAGAVADFYEAILTDTSGKR